MTDDMMSFVSDPLILEIFLYQNNYKDRILLSEMKKRAQLVKMGNEDSNSFFVRIEDIEDILLTSFIRDINNFDSTSKLDSTSVTSIYFIDNIIKSYRYLKYFKVNVSDSEVYSRKSENKIVFDYRIIHSRIDLPSVLTPEDLIEVQQMLKDAKIYEINPFDLKPYFEMTVKDLFYHLNNYAMDLDPESDEFHLIVGLKALIGPKMEIDDPVVLVIVEE